ncbi:MAG: hypothetical protein U0822_01700 [Anaerolineae bacterium]
MRHKRIIGRRAAYAALILLALVFGLQWRLPAGAGIANAQGPEGEEVAAVAIDAPAQGLEATAWQPALVPRLAAPDALKIPAARALLRPADPAELKVSPYGILAPAATPLETFYLPLPEPQVRQALAQVSSATPTSNQMRSVTSISITVDNTKVYYDQWEDGYEADLSNPVQSTTQIWGDGNAANGCAPNINFVAVTCTNANDVLQAGDVIILDNLVPIPGTPPTPYPYNGRDKVGATDVVAIVRAEWAPSPGTLLALGMGAYDTTRWGTNFRIPIGENTIASGDTDIFEYTSVFVMASQDNTNVQIDKDANGTFETTTTLNQGEAYQVDGGVNVNAQVKSDKPIQVAVMGGKVNSSYMSRWYSVPADSLWDSSYYSPVGTTDTNHPASIFLYNPDQSNQITVNYETSGGGTGTINVPAKGNARFQVASNVGYHWYTANGAKFLAVGANDASLTGGDTDYDWGYDLVPENWLTTEFVAGWAPGTDPNQTCTPGNGTNQDGTCNGSPVWVTAPSATTIYVKYDGDVTVGGTGTAPNGYKYDASYSITAFQSLQIFDPDKNQTGMRVFTTDGTVIAGAWGEDPSQSQRGQPYIDAGYTIPPLPIPKITKTAAIVDTNGNSQLDAGEKINYTITVTNRSPFSIPSAVLTDTLPANTTYVANSTKVNGSAYPDDGTGTPFPLDGSGINLGTIAVGGSIPVTFQVQTNTGAAYTSVTNTASVTALGFKRSATVTTPVTQTPALTLKKTASPTTYSTVGQTISYSYLLTNSGNVNLTQPYAVSDNKATVTCPTTPSPLTPGSSVTCTASYTITQADLNSGSVTNTATATAKGPSNQTVTSNQDQQTVTATQSPALTLDKTASPTTYSTVGQTITYSYKLTNSGNVTLSAPYTVTDNKATVICPSTPTTIAPNAFVTCSATYTITQADLDAGSVTNTATGSAKFGNNTVNSNQDTATVTATQTKALTLAKTASPGTYNAVNQTISYSYKLTNSGNVTLYAPYAVTDDKAASVTCPSTPASIAPNAFVTCTATYSIKQADLDAGSVTNKATATAKDSGGSTVTSNQAQATVNATQSPALTLDKTASPTTYSTVGQTITYSYKLTNSGNVTLSAPYTVTDNKATVTCPSTPTTIAPNAFVTCSATYTITQADLNAGSVTNTATGSAKFGNTTVNSNQDTATVTANQSASLNLLKQVSTSSSGPWSGSVTLTSPGTVYYQFTLKNTGNVTLSSPFTITDAVLTGRSVTVTCPTGTLAPNATVTCTASTSVTQTDINNGGFTNTATASAKDPQNNTVTSNTSTANVLVTATPALQLVKQVSTNSNGPWANSVTVSAPGTVYYRFTLQNTGNVTLSSPFAITDAVLTGRSVTVTCPTGTLAPNATVTCTASTSVTQTDINNGGFTNTATATAKDPQNNTVTSNQDTAQVNVNQTPQLTLKKTASPTTYSSVGQTISYSYLLTNSGNVTLTTPYAVSDDKATVTCPATPTSLAPNGTVTCTATYTITQADLDAGSVTNKATATAKFGNTTVNSNQDQQTVNASPNPQLTLDKTASPTTYSTVGQTITYSYKLTNSGNVTLSAPYTVNDNKATVTCPSTPTTIAPNAFVTCSATYTITQADLNAGSVTNTATGSAKFGNTTVNSNQDTATVTANQNPSLNLLKQVSTSSSGPWSSSVTLTSPGTVYYQFTLQNTGNVTLSSPFTITDAVLTGRSVTVTCPTGTLAPNATVTCTASTSVTQTDINNGGFANTATATAKDPQNNTVTSNTSTANVLVTATPALQLVKQVSTNSNGPWANSVTVSAPTTVYYQFTLKNTGNVTLSSPFAITDAVLTGRGVTVICQSGTLAPNATLTCAANTLVTQADIDNGGFTNTATATAKDPQNNTVTSNQDTAQVNVNQTPALTLAKTASPGTYNAVNQTISYSYKLTNSGNVTLYAPYAVGDDKATVTCPATPTSIAPGSFVTCTATYSITQADLDTGSVTNHATATAKDPNNQTVTSNQAQQTVNANPNPQLTLDKTASPTTYSTVGQTITYSYKLTNSGNVTLSAPYTVADNKATVTCPATPTSIAPGSFVTCSATYTITQADLDAGKVINIATGQAKFGDAPVTSNQDTAEVDATQSPALTLAKTASPTTYNAVNQTISYSYKLTNSGNVTLYAPYAVTDNKASVTCPSTPTSIAPGSFVTCTATYSISQADLDVGSVTNTATATAKDPKNQTVTSNQDQQTVTANQSASLNLLKEVSTSANGPWSASVTVTTPGNVYYRFTLTNTGNVTLKQPFAVDDLVLQNRGVTVTCPATPTTLAPSAQIVCTASTLVTQTDINDGGFNNTATATGKDPEGNTVTSNQSKATVLATQTPVLELVKEVSASSNGPWANSVTVSAPGTVYYRFTLRNSGNVTLSSPFVVNDAVLTGRGVTVTCPTGTLAPNATTTCTASTSVTQADIDKDGFTNTATATAQDPNNQTVTSNEDTAQVNVNQNPQLTLKKAADPKTYNAANQTVSYTYTLTNTGNVTLSAPYAVSDDKVTVNCPSTPANLAPGQAVTCSATYSITQGDVDTGSVTNHATATAKDPKNQTVTSNQDQQTVTAQQSPALTLDKTASPTTYSTVGQSISYSYKLTNSGNVTLSAPYAVTDNKVTVNCPSSPATLAPNGTVTCTATYSITQADLDAGKVTNIATATAKDPNNQIVTSNQDTETVNATQTPTLKLEKTASPGTYNAVNQTISYSYKLTNTGNVTLSAPYAVSDDKATVTCPATPTSIAPNAFVTCTATYSISQADLDAGSVTNHATATAKDPKNQTVTSNQDQQTVTATQTKSLTLDKTASPTTYNSVGQTISYSYQLTNSGNVTLSAPYTVTDDKVTVTCPATPTTLAPTLSVLCTASHVITQADLDAGSITNTARGHASFGGNPVDSNQDQQTVTADQNPSLNLLKEVSTSVNGPWSASVTLTTPGTVYYRFTLRNTGNVTLSGPFAVSDTALTNRGVTVTCPTATSLAPNATLVCTASTAVTQTDIDNGGFANTATASAKAPNGEPITSNPSDANVFVRETPQLALLKEVSTSANGPWANSVTLSAPATVYYRFTLRNTGNVTLNSPFEVTDAVLTDRGVTVTCPSTPSSIAPNETTTCTASTAVTQTDINNDGFNNTATASALGPDDQRITSNESQAQVNVNQEPGIHLTKSATPNFSSPPKAGDTISYGYDVKNTGNVSLNTINLTDDKCSPTYASGDTNNNGLLDPNETWHYTCSYVLKQSDIDAGSVTNTATVTSKLPNGSNGPTSTDSKTVEVQQSPDIYLAKSATPVFGTPTRPGDKINYGFAVTNTGNETLNTVVLSDARCDTGSLSGPTGDSGNGKLDPGETWNYTCTYTLKQSDIDAGDVDNTATVTSKLPNGSNGPTSTDSKTVEVPQTPAIQLVKSATPAFSTPTKPGDKITYNFAVTNTGDLTLNSIQLTDAKCNVGTLSGPTGDSGNGKLDPGETWNYTCSHALTQADIDAGKVVNVADVTSRKPDQTPGPTSEDTKTVEVPQTPGLNATKTATPQTFGRVNDVIHYTLTAVNTGNTTLTNVSLSDTDTPLTNFVCKIGTVTVTPPVTLPVGKTLVCTGDYTITQADVERGKHENTATATSDQTPPSTASAIVYYAKLSLVKTSPATTFAQLGEQVTFSYTLTNEGNTDLHPPYTVKDDHITAPSAVTCPNTPDPLKPGDSVTCTATYRVQQIDIDNGRVTNVAVATAQYRGETAVTVVSNNDQWTLRYVPAPKPPSLIQSGSTYYQVPVLGAIGNTKTGVDWVIEAQNLGSTWTKVALLLFAENSGFCQPQAQNPFKIECSGMLKPGTSWVWTASQLPASAKSAIAISYNPFPGAGNPYWRCEDWTNTLNKLSWPEGWPSVNPLPGQFPFDWNPFYGEPIGIEVTRRGPGNTNPSLTMASSYSAVSAKGDGRYDPLFGGFAYYAPTVYSGFNGWNSWLYIQNSGSECTSVELWFKAQDDCLRSQICSVAQLSPGYTAQFNVSGCVPTGFTGSVWIRASQPLGIIVDQIGQDVLMSYTGSPGSLCYIFNGQCLDLQGGSTVAYGPLIYRETNGWGTSIHVQNMSGVTAAKVKVYFMDQSGDIITTLVDWVCPRGETSFPLTLVSNLPGNYVGAVRVESQAWQSPGDPNVNASPIAAVAELLNYSSPTKVTQAAAYNLFPQEQTYLWQIGAGDASGLESGVGLIGIPSLMQRGNSLNLVTDLAIQNVVPKPGFTDFVVYVYDQNGLIDYVCEKLNEKQVEYVNLDNWDWIRPGFVGSAVISAVYWEHDVLTGVPIFGPSNPQLPILLRNVVGLAAVKVERVIPSTSGPGLVGDLSTASEGFPMPPGFDFEGYTPQCPGVPTSCGSAPLNITICEPVYGQAVVTVVDDSTGAQAFQGIPDANGVVAVPAVLTGRTYKITVADPGKDYVTYTGQGYTARVPAISAVILAPCQSQTPAVPYSVSLTPPTGVVEGYEFLGRTPTGVTNNNGVWSGAPQNPAAGVQLQLWLAPTAANQPGTYLQTAMTNTEGYFKFSNLNPCLLYELKFTGNNAVVVIPGVAATIAGQKYMVSATAGIYPPGPLPLP